MQLRGGHFIGERHSASGGETFRATNAATGEHIEPPFHDATEAEIDRACRVAADAFEIYRQQSAETVATFLDEIPDAIMALGDRLIERANIETALPVDRLTGERARTCSQLRMFSALVREGSWCDARIDTAQPDRKPLPKPDVRRMLIGIGPVAVFGASNFPLAFSVAGGDTASAFAAGCTVVVKAHPAHPGTSELVARAIIAAARDAGMRDGVFSMLHGRMPETSLALVRHGAIKAVGFTGSHEAGRALFDAAATRRDPIPVFAEMSSVNPVFVLRRALAERGAQIAEGWKQSVTMGVGQFCTKPGLLFGVGAMDDFASAVAAAIMDEQCPPMLHGGIARAFDEGLANLAGAADVHLVARSDRGATSTAVLQTDVTAFAKNPRLSQELFGPGALIIKAGTIAELEAVARDLDGQLTATIHATAEDLEEARGLIAILEQKVGRLLFNGFPTGVEVCPSMHHGGPYPATTDAQFTSVGTAAIARWVRPICFQTFPQSALPIELRDENARKIWRLVNNQWTREAIEAK
jgi:2,5-dioxopentanoate dehydrogenase